MKQHWNGIDRRKSLRSNADAIVASLSPDKLAANPAAIMLHELLVHKVELEMQNDELLKAHIELEKARDRYIDLYEFAPIGYITINREGLINEINLTGSSLLGVDRAKLINRRFSKFVAEQDRDQWYRLFMNMMQHKTAEKHEFSLEMTRADDSLFFAHFDCLRREALDTPPVLRVALTDISRFKQTLKE